MSTLEIPADTELHKSDHPDILADVVADDEKFTEEQRIHAAAKLLALYEGGDPRMTDQHLACVANNGEVPYCITAQQILDGVS